MNRFGTRGGPQNPGQPFAPPAPVQIRQQPFDGECFNFRNPVVRGHGDRRDVFVGSCGCRCGCRGKGLGGPAHILTKSLHPPPRVVPQVGDENSRGKVVELAAFRCPVAGPSRLGEHRLRRGKRPQGNRFIIGNDPTNRVGPDLTSKLNRISHY